MLKRAIVIFPESEQIELIQQIREAHDPLARLIPPHITLVFPFDSEISTKELARHMSSAVQNFRPFTLSLRGITGHTGEYLFLNVKVGNDQLISLHDQLYTGLLAPYFTAAETYFPHLTVGRLGDPAAFAHALKQMQAINSAFEAEIRQISAYLIGPNGKRQVECQAALA
ncbi:2'-5' RNA ligase family protein [Dictyobacter aurantiacus]|uniref:2'-5' RNA ligase n=1 Tax=Dictyobacter aurantiacus TaxID=1936993 RepID=A0A401ZMV8_9CHLR|nr:2'-5' RNA ligase family protein [Dictyobacter aurantiacus]GCE08211.1 2'-5' RNA ligase [Dictyobacter aurantiacus]